MASKFYQVLGHGAKSLNALIIIDLLARLSVYCTYIK